jgi:sugar phosphate isomerase/epimerase
VCEAAGPHLRLVFDTGNAFTWNEDPVDTWNAMKAKVIHAHLKDWTCADFDKPPRGIKGKDYKPALVGQGLLPYPRLLAAMKASGFTGCLAFEYEGKEDRIEMARQGIRYLQEMLAALP